MSRKHLEVDYDPDVDILCAARGDARGATTVEVDKGFVVRLAPRTHEAVGLEIINCAERFNKAPEAITRSFTERLLDEYGPRALAALRSDAGCGACSTEDHLDRD